MRSDQNAEKDCEKVLRGNRVRDVTAMKVSAVDC